MKTIKKYRLFIIAFLLMGAFVISVNLVPHDDYYQHVWEFELINNNTEYELVHAKSGVNIKVPKTYRNKPVTSIGSAAFIALPNCDSTLHGNKSLRTVYLPKTIKTIGSEAFAHAMNLRKVTFERGSKLETIEHSAFYNCPSLTKINIPNAVSSIETNAFDGSKWLKNKKGVIYIGKVLYGYNSDVPENLVIPNNIVRINNQALEGNTQIKSVTMNDNIRIIGASAFNKCANLADIIINDSVEYIGSKAFDETAWYASQPEGVVYAGNFLYSFKGEMPENTVINVKQGTVSIVNGVFYNNPHWSPFYSGLVGVNLPDSVISIEANAFGHCTNLKNVSISDSSLLQRIGRDAFRYCSSLPEINLPQGIKEIGESAFSECSSLTRINIPDNIILGETAFMGCTALTEIELPNGVAVYDGPFRRSGLEGVVKIPDDAKILMTTFMGCENITDVVFGLDSKLKDIISGAFACSQLKSIVIPKTVTRIIDSFYACDSLEKIYYGGANQIEFNRIKIDERFNQCLLNAELYFYSQNAPQTPGRYWRYVDDMPTAW